MRQPAPSTARARDFTGRSSPSGLPRSSRIPLTRQGEGSSMPISITRVYTRTGDKGETSLVGGKRIPKDSPRIVAYGTVDELNAVVGLVRVFNAERLDEGERHRWLDGVLREVRKQLFGVGSGLATAPAAALGRVDSAGGGEVDAHGSTG